MPVYPLGKGHQINFSQDGIRFKKNYPDLESKKDAELLEAQLKVKLRMGDLYKKGEEDFLTFCKTEWLPWAREHYSRDESQTFFKAFAAAFKGKRLNSITSFEIERWKQKLSREQIVFRNKKGEITKSKPRSKKRVNRYLSALSTVFQVAQGLKIYKENPVLDVERFREGPGRIRYLSDDERTAMEAVKDQIPEYCLNIVTILHHTGMRFSEVTTLRVEQLNFRVREIFLPKPKSQEPETVPMNETVYTLLWELKDKAINGYLFANPKTRKPYTRIGKSFAFWMKLAGIEEFTIHCLRHDVATQLANDPRFSLREVQGLLRHKRITTTELYAHQKKDSIRRAAHALEEKRPESVPSILEWRNKQVLNR